MDFNLWKGFSKIKYDILADDIKAGKELQNTPIGNVIFKNLDKDPKVQKALKLVKQKIPLSPTLDGDG